MAHFWNLIGTIYSVSPHNACRWTSRRRRAVRHRNRNRGTGLSLHFPLSFSSLFFLRCKGNEKFRERSETDLFLDNKWCYWNSLVNGVVCCYPSSHLASFVCGFPPTRVFTTFYVAKVRRTVNAPSTDILTVSLFRDIQTGSLPQFSILKTGYSWLNVPQFLVFIPFPVRLLHGDVKSWYPTAYSQ